MAAVLSVSDAFSQQGPLNDKRQPVTTADSELVPVDSARQKDIIDVVQKLLDKKTSPEKRKLPQKANFSIIPYAGYTLSTGFVAGVGTAGSSGFLVNLGEVFE